MTLTDSVESVKIGGFDEITQDDVLESFELYLKRKCSNELTEIIPNIIKDYQAYMKELRQEELDGANEGMSDNDWERDR